MGRTTKASPPLVAGTQETDTLYVHRTNVPDHQGKIPVEKPFFWGHEPILRDTLTGRLRLIVNRSRTVGLWGGDCGLPCGNRFDQVAGTPDGAHLPAKGTQLDRETGNGPAY